MPGFTRASSSITHDGVQGIAVHIGARVGAAAGAGEVLTSRTVRDLVAGSGISFAERGSQRLKGLDGEWELYAAEIELREVAD